MDSLSSSARRIHGLHVRLANELDKKEKAIYYLSKKFTSWEIKYIDIEKMCYALAWALRKLWQYMLYFSTRLILCMDPIKYIFETPALTRKISHWKMLLRIQYRICSKKTIKVQAVANYLADQPLNDPKFSKSLFPNEDVLGIDLETSNMEPWHWKLYFDGVANTTRNGVGVVLVSSKG